MKIENLKLALFRLKKVIECSDVVDFDANYNTYERKIIDSFELCVYRLKVKNDERTSHIEDLIANKETEYLENFWKTENNSQYKLFGLMLGILDGTIADKIEAKASIKEFDTNIQMRESVQAHYTKINNSNYIRPVDALVLNYPSSRYFLKEYSEVPKNDPYFTFILNYTYGYSNSDKVNVDVLYEIFDRLLVELEDHIKNNLGYIKSLQK